MILPHQQVPNGSEFPSIEVSILNSLISSCQNQGLQSTALSLDEHGKAVKKRYLAKVQTMSRIKYKTHLSPGITGAFALKSGWSQRHKGFEVGEQYMLVSGGWVERSRLPMQSESIQLHLCASSF